MSFFSKNCSSILGISQYKDFCKYLLPNLYNTRFKKHVYEQNNKNVFRYINTNDIRFIFDRTSKRKVARTSNIRIENDIYKAINQNGRKVPLYSDNIYCT